MKYIAKFSDYYLEGGNVKKCVFDRLNIQNLAFMADTCIRVYWKQKKSIIMINTYVL